MAKVIRSCKYCGKEFSVFPCKLKTGRGIYCSRVCSGKDHPPHNKGKIGVCVGDKCGNWKGGIPNCTKCGKKLSTRHSKYSLCRACLGSNETYVKTLVDAHRKPIEEHKKKPYDRQVRSSSEFREWRNLIFKENDYTCQICGDKGVHLHPHHIFSFSHYPDLRFYPSNGTTLCVGCHYKVHTKDLPYAQNGWYVN